MNETKTALLQLRAAARNYQAVLKILAEKDPPNGFDLLAEGYSGFMAVLSRYQGVVKPNATETQKAVIKNAQAESQRLMIESFKIFGPVAQVIDEITVEALKQ